MMTEKEAQEHLAKTKKNAAKGILQDALKDFIASKKTVRDYRKLLIGGFHAYTDRDLGTLDIQEVLEEVIK